MPSTDLILGLSGSAVAILSLFGKLEYDRRKDKGEKEDEGETRRFDLTLQLGEGFIEGNADMRRTLSQRVTDLEAKLDAVFTQRNELLTRVSAQATKIEDQDKVIGQLRERVETLEEENRRLREAAQWRPDEGDRRVK